MTNANKIKKELNKFKNKEKAKIYQRFFKTDRGEYGEGDVFLGISVPQQRIIAKDYTTLELKEIKKLLESKIHEHRFIATAILVYQYKKANKKNKKTIFDFYIKNRKFINNWDLVDTSTPQIVGNYLLNRDKSILYKYSKSKNLWDKRISILATLEFIKNNNYYDTIRISENLLKDEHDLIHKAVGWMLREAGKKDIKILLRFLDKFSQDMPRTMLRYAIEKFPEKERKKILQKKSHNLEQLSKQNIP